MEVQNPVSLPSDSPAYQYIPLQSQRSVRLLALKPSGPSTPLVVSLTEACIDDDPVYEAVSYTWATEDGDDARSRMLFCDGGYVRMTVNCEAVLRRFRQADVERVLWIDAICINQEDLVERGYQVQLMGELYRKASCVLAWLGEASEIILGSEDAIPASDFAFECLRELGKEMISMVDSGVTMLGGPRYLFMRTELDGNTGTRSAFFRIFDSLFSRRWWKRLWILQEVVLAKRLVFFCGNATLDLSLLRQICHGVVQDRSEPGRKAYSFLKTALGLTTLIGAMETKEVVSWLGFDYILPSVLHSARHREASNPRDRMYGVQGLLNHFEEIFPTPDYSKSLGAVFKDVTKAAITHTNSLGILRQLAWPPKVCDLPSWAFDWFLEFIDPSLYNVYNAANETQAIYHFGDNDVELQVKGTVISHVKEVADQFSPSRMRILPSPENGDYKMIRTWQQ